MATPAASRSQPKSSSQATSATTKGRVVTPQNIPSHINNAGASSSSPLPAAPRSVPSNSPAAQRHVALGSNSKSQSPYTGAQTRSPAGLIPNFDVIASSLGMDRNPSLNRSLLSKGKQTSALGRGTDEERLKKLNVIVEKLRQVLPRLSPAGLEIIGQRAGMDATFDPLNGPRLDGTRDCYLAGETIAVEVGFRSESIVDKALLSVGTSEGRVSIVEFEKSASNVLQQTLMKASATLDKFDANLARLSKLDRLSGPAGKGFNAFEAVVGVYNCFRVIYDHEMKKTMSDAKSEAHALRTVLCKKSGYPRMNARQTLGVSLDYWMQGRAVYSKDINELDTFSLSIECESCPAKEFAHARASSTWIADEIEKPAGEDSTETILELVWLEPPFPESEPASVPVKKEEEHTAVKNTAVRFVAKFDPPLVVPLDVARELKVLVGLKDAMDSVDVEDIKLYHDLLLGTQTDIEEIWAGADMDLWSTRTFEGKPKEDGTPKIVHKNSLYQQVCVGSVLKELPFSHPKQLLQVIPILRQWAFIDTLMKRSFPHPRPGKYDSKQDENTVSVDITFDTAQCRFGFFFTAKSKRENELIPITIALEIRPNADIVITDQSINPVSNSRKIDLMKMDTSLLDTEAGGSRTAGKLAGGLDIAQDFDVWITWIEDALEKLK